MSLTSRGAPALGMAPFALAGPVVAVGRPSGAALHLLLAFGLLLLAVAFVGAMRRAWSGRAQEQEEDLPDLPEPPEQTGNVLAAPLRGRYLGTVDAGHWREWIAARGLAGHDGDYIAVYEQGVRVDRDGHAFWIPREAVRGARLERGHAGKVAAPSRLVVVAWSFDGRELETGFRGEDRARQPRVVRSVHDLIGPMPTAPLPGDITSPHAVPRVRARLRPRVTTPRPTPTPGAVSPEAAGAGAAGRRVPGPGPGPATMPIPVIGRQPRRRSGNPLPGNQPRLPANGTAGHPVGTPHLGGPTSTSPVPTGSMPTGPVPTRPVSTGPVPTGPVPTSAAHTGSHEVEAHTTGIRRTGAHGVVSYGGSLAGGGTQETAVPGTGGYPTGGYPATGGYPTGGYPAGAQTGGVPVAGGHATGAHGFATGAHSTGAYETQGYDTGGYHTAGYDTAGFDQGGFDTGAYGTAGHSAVPPGTRGYDTGAYEVGRLPERERPGQYSGPGAAGYHGGQPADAARQPWAGAPAAGWSPDPDRDAFAVPPPPSSPTGERVPGWE
ncbi:hypothetical protein CcI49_32310 [Frankia sp. CcI49]|uniref:PH-like domain-containing protein n=1 Tax=Frankia sp. CcI49 TaxID=1745382 RepID=UPI000975530A|nr:hypothetical protein [Frankia sp. CcI49]ONH53384.1 hypothetical protein CcI49_32310 [Frankia sp. CcI49]